MDASYDFAKLFHDTKYEDIPQNVIEEVRKQILDYLGVALAGGEKPGAKEVREFYLENGGTEQATAWGIGKKLPVTSAVHINATMGHTLDFDDVNEDAIMHPGVVAIPTSLAMAEYVGKLTGKDFMACVTLAGDMICRMSIAAYPKEPSKISFGWHYTTLNGSIVSANLAAKILGLPVEQAVDAMGIAYHQTAGNGQCVPDGALTKRLGPGFVTRNGITSAILAKKGVTGAKNIFYGNWGLTKIYHKDNWDADRFVWELGKHWESGRTSIKPYPCCRGLHHFCDLGIEYHNKLNPDDIKTIEIWCGPGTVPLLGQPLSVKAHPSTIVESQFSIAWGLCCGLALGHVSLNEYTDTDYGIHNEKVLALTSKIISLEGDPELGVNAFDGAKIRITMNDGTVYEERRDFPKGTPDNPLTWDDVVAKFWGCIHSADHPISDEKAQKIIDYVLKLEDKDNVTDLIKLLTWDDFEN